MASLVHSKVLARSKERHIRKLVLRRSHSRKPNRTSHIHRKRRHKQVLRSKELGSKR